MKRTVDVVYDGEVLRPQEPLDLEPNARYRVTIEGEAARPSKPTRPRALGRILARARDLGIPDLAEQHDHYLYGLPKQKL